MLSRIFLLLGLYVLLQVSQSFHLGQQNKLLTRNNFVSSNLKQGKFQKVSKKLFSENNQEGNEEKKEDDPEDTIKKYGLEAGLYKAATSKDGKIKPKDLLAKYGIAYLATSITLAIFSYGFFYVLVLNGVDVASLLEKVGISASSVATNTGTAAIAYALHKAASPIRFPPTVLLTPVVAGWLGKKPKDETSSK
jgi:hypothetical protein